MLSVRLPNKLGKNPFTFREARGCGLTQYDLKRLLSAQVVEKVEKNIYQTTDSITLEPEEQYYLASKKCGFPSAICLLSALDYYHVTGQIVKKTWVMVPQEKRIVSLNLKLVRVRNPQWDIGIHKTKKYWVTTLERTLVDCLLFERFLGFQIGMEAIKQALSQKKTTLSIMMNMARKMGVAHRLTPYIKVLSL